MGQVQIGKSGNSDAQISLSLLGEGGHNFDTINDIEPVKYPQNGLWSLMS